MINPTPSAPTPQPIQAVLESMDDEDVLRHAEWLAKQCFDQIQFMVPGVTIWMPVAEAIMVFRRETFRRGLQWATFH